ncbi:MAC/perforin domain-containing protein [Endothiovibrio diazotrophicus]
MSILHSVPLGQTASLLHGYRPGWNPAAGELKLLVPARQRALAAQPLPELSARGDWGYPEVSLHDTPESLLSALFDYTVEAPGEDAPQLPAGALTLFSGDGPRSRETLQARLGVPLNDQRRYALVKLTREDGEARYDTAKAEVDEAFTRELEQLGSALEQEPALTAERAAHYLRLFEEWGTHYVSAVRLGDRIVQVFAYAPEPFERVRAAHAGRPLPLRDLDALDFVYFTSPAGQAVDGFVAEYGNLLCLSHSRTFVEQLAGGEWREEERAHGDSIFAPFLYDRLHRLDRLNREYRDQAPIGVRLAPMNSAGDRRGRRWERVFKSAMAAVFGGRVTLRFPPSRDTRAFRPLLGDDHGGLLSTLPTPTINLYRGHLDLAELRLAHRETVEEFTAYGYVIAADSATPVALPGSRRVRLVGHILDLRTPGNAGGEPTVLELAGIGPDALEIHCGRFLGVARLQRADGEAWEVICDGLRYRRGSDGMPRVTGNVFAPPSAEALDEVCTSIEFSMAFAEAVLGFQRSPSADEAVPPLQQVVRDYLRWLPRGGITEAPLERCRRRVELTRLRLRASDLGGYRTDADHGAFVPLLHSSRYERPVQDLLALTERVAEEIRDCTRQIDRRCREERDQARAETLNRNIIDSGRLLARLIQATAKHRGDLAAHYDAVLHAQEGEATRQKTQIGFLEERLHAQQQAVDAAAMRYREALQVELEEQAFQASIGVVFDVAANLFTLAKAVVVPGAQAGAFVAAVNLAQSARDIQNIQDVFKSTTRLYDAAARQAGDEMGRMLETQRSLDRLGGGSFGDTGKLLWNETVINFRAVMAQSKSTDAVVAAAAAELATAFELLVLRGKAVVGAKAKLHQLLREIHTAEGMKGVNEAHAKRLQRLIERLDGPAAIRPLEEKGEIDLVGLTGLLDFQRRQMLAMLAKTFLLQDQALQYETLQPPTLIRNYAILGFLDARRAQGQARIAAESALAARPANELETVVVKRRVSSDALLHGACHALRIPSDDPQFAPYVTLRVVDLVVRVAGIERTDGGHYNVRATFQSAPFYDRDLTRRRMTFHTPSRTMSFIHPLDDAGSAASGPTPPASSDERPSEITPFGEWLIELPEVPTNRGLRLPPLVEVALELTVSNRIVEEEEGHGNPAQSPQAAPAVGATPPPAAAPAAAAPPPAPAPVAADTSSPAVTTARPAEREHVDLLVKKMFDHKSKTVTRDWDIVISMSLDEARKTLNRQYEKLKRDAGYRHEIANEARYPLGDGQQAVVRLEFTYGYPRLDFSPDAPDHLLLQMEIGKGTLTRRIVDAHDATVGEPVTTTLAQRTLSAFLDLKQVKGTVTAGGASGEVLDVVLDLGRGAFVIDGIAVDGETGHQVSRAIQQHFAAHRVSYLLHRIDLKKVAVDTVLRPTAFRFRATRTPRGVELLQLFVMTGHRPLPVETAIDLDEPLPDGADCSVIIARERFFMEVANEALRGSGWQLSRYNAQSTGYDLSGEITVDAPKWSRDEDGGLVFAHVDRYHYSVNGGALRHHFRSIHVEYWEKRPGLLVLSRGDQLRVDVEVFHQRFSKFWDAWEEKGRYKFGYEGFLRFFIGVKVTIESRPNAPGQWLKITAIHPEDPSIAPLNLRRPWIEDRGIIGDRWNIPGHCGQHMLEAAQNDTPRRIEEKLLQPLKALPLFAVRNLIFPDEGAIEMQAEAHVPGDLLILGNFRG